ncbi:hypothetical protein PybrP1_006857 [[Pythium] brassicae (nom. inval.)]|nr:hypothetical protein PybrP1_006857 [[Pythium] brassicae (nom. inval.)]
MADSERMGDALSPPPQDSEENQFGLHDLAQLPLLEQVHRLFHAIQMQYPYKETTAWKSLPLDQKKRMLEYIRDKRARKATASEESGKTATTTTTTTAPPIPASSPPAQSIAPAPKAAAANTDLYLQMLQRRTVVAPAARGATTTPGGSAPHPNSAYIAPAQVAQYAERRTRAARWKVVDAEFFDEACGACGAVHNEFDGAKGALLSTVAAMMSTFGDARRPCAHTAHEVKNMVGEHLRSSLGQLAADELNTGPGLRPLAEAFHEEAAYYGRWREFRGESKHEQNELEDVEEEELAEELDLFAVAEADSVFNEGFLERIRFADERTKAMNWSNYDAFARGRKLNFMSSKGQQFRHWLHLGKSSRASLEFMNFVAYHNIGRLVELGIKNRAGGVLQALATPLTKSDVQAVATAFSSNVQTATAKRPASESQDAASDAPAAKVRRVSTRVGDVTVTEHVVSAAAAPSASGSVPPEPLPTALETSSRAPTPPGSDTKARPTRLKRLR